MDADRVIGAVSAVILTLLIKLQRDYHTLLLVLEAMKERRRAQEVVIGTSRCLAALSLPPPRTRAQWMKVRSRDWWERVVLLEFSDLEWKENFRMTRRSFSKLCALSEGFMAPDEVTVRAPVPCAMRVAVALYRLGRCAEYRVVSDRFGIHKSTVKKFTHMFCKGFLGGPVKELIKMPSDEEATEIARRFEAAHFIPRIMGVIDGTHIPVRPPSDGHRDFVNRNGWPSYVLQAVVDDRCCFRNISCKMPGRARDADVLHQSGLFQRAHMLPQDVKNIEGEDVKLFLVGDPAYPLLDWLMKEHGGSPHLTPEQESFNAYLASVRGSVDVSFGILRSRWRVLLRRSEFHFTFAPTMIATCCALHNFCQRENDLCNSDWVEELCDPAASYPQPEQPAHRQDSACGDRAREALTRYMAKHFPLRTGHLH